MLVAVVGLGANLGDRRATLARAMRALAELPGVVASSASSLYETAPVGGPPQPPFLNAAMRLELDPPRSARALVQALLALERELGRVRGETDVRFGPRVIDLDLLWTSAGASTHEDALVPHPRLHERAFALVPFLEVTPEARGAYADALAQLDTTDVRRVG